MLSQNRSVLTDFSLPESILSMHRFADEGDKANDQLSNTSTLKVFIVNKLKIQIYLKRPTVCQQTTLTTESGLVES